MNPTANTAAAPTPAGIFQLLQAYQGTQALRGAIELELFTKIAEGAHTPAEIAAQCHASERGVRILCDYLVIAGLLTKTDAQYSLTPDSAMFLDKRSPAYLGVVTSFLNSNHITDAFRDLAATVRNGTTLMGGEGSMDPDHPMWVEFARSMMPMMFGAAQEIAQFAKAKYPEKCRVLDLAAGHGVFGIAIAKKNPQAEITAVDWKNVLTVAQEHAQAFGVADRYQTLAGSAFDVDYGTGYDLVLFTNFFHHFDQPTCEMLMKKAHASLNENGCAVTLEFAPNEDRVSPPMLAGFALTMLATTAAGDAYTVSEYEKMFANAGFARSEMHQLTMSPQRVIMSYK